ncbi:hypothetical protein APA_2627 [Pseudanabaena sp. lw0831]|nr:hypothetical protein APA_2627 [Pseudanabaena sp. lw0831]
MYNFDQELGQIKTQINEGGASLRLHLFGFYVLICAQTTNFLGFERSSYKQSLTEYKKR